MSKLVDLSIMAFILIMFGITLLAFVTFTYVALPGAIEFILPFIAGVGTGKISTMM